MNEQAFRPSRWLLNGHAQTLWRRFSSAPRIDHNRQRVELADGDFIDIDWHDSVSLCSEETTVLLLHGLCGCSRSGYIQSLQHRLAQAGYRSVAINFRGCSGETNRLARSYHSGVTADIAEVFEAVRAGSAANRFAAVGFSLGANVLLKWLGESASDLPVSRAVAVSTPFNLALCSQAMLTGVSRLYGRHFLTRLVADLKSKKAYFEQLGNTAELATLNDCGDLDRIATLWDFDDRVTAPLHGFKDAADYYQQCSSGDFLKAIKVPTLLLQSLDDPIIPPAALPEAGHLSDTVHFDLSKRGGHVGFASAADRYWLENRIVDFIANGSAGLR